MTLRGPIKFQHKVQFSDEKPCSRRTKTAMGINGHSRPVQDSKPPDFRGSSDRPENATAMLIDADHVNINTGDPVGVLTERNQFHEKSTLGESNTTLKSLHNDGSVAFNSKEGHVWEEIASKYQQIVERDISMLTSNPRPTNLVYRSLVALNDETVDETDCINNTGHPINRGANKKHVDSSTSTVEDEQVPSKYYIIHGVNPANEDTMVNRVIDINCPRILHSFSLNESHCHSLQGQHIQQQEEYSGMTLGMVGLHGSVYSVPQVHDAWTTCNGVIKTVQEADTISSEMKQSRQHAVKIEPSENTNCCYAKSQNANTGNFDGERIPFQIQGRGTAACSATSADFIGRVTTNQMVQGQCLQQEHGNQMEMENIRTFCILVEDSKTSVPQRNCIEKEESRTPAGPFSVNEQEPVGERKLPNLTDRNIIFGINCESNGSEITLKYSGTEDKGTQYLVEDTGLFPATTKPSVSSSSGIKNVGVPIECETSTQCESSRNTLLSNSYLSPNVSTSKENPAMGIEEQSALGATEDNAARNSSHKMSRQPTDNGSTVDHASNTASEEDVLSSSTVGSLAAKRHSESIDPQECKITKLKRLLEKQEEELEKVRRRVVTDCSERTIDRDQGMVYMENMNGRVYNSDTVVSGQLSSNGHKTKGKKTSSPRRNIKKDSDYRFTLSQVIRTEMAKQNRKGKRKGECYAYLDSTGSVVFGRQGIKRKSVVSPNHLEKLIFRLRKSFGKKNAVLRKKSTSKSLAQAQGLVPNETRKYTKDAPQHPSSAKQIPLCTNAPLCGCKTNMFETVEVSCPPRNDGKKQDNQDSLSLGCSMGTKAAFKDDDMPRNNEDEFLAVFGLARKTLDMVTRGFSADYGGRRRRFLDHEIQPTDCRGMLLGAGFEYRDEQGWFIIA